MAERALRRAEKAVAVADSVLGLGLAAELLEALVWRRLVGRQRPLRCLGVSSFLAAASRVLQAELLAQRRVRWELSVAVGLRER